METLSTYPDPGVLPVSRLDDPDWRARHLAFVKQTAAGGFRVAFIGDSITMQWEEDGRDAWNSILAPLGAANFGIGGDGTYNLLWRFANGEVLGSRPPVFVLLIGTNNIGWGICDATQTADGVKAVVKTLQADSPDSRILLVQILPRGEMPEDPFRVEVERTNALLRTFDFGPGVTLLDHSGLFLSPDGTIPADLMPDFLHLSPRAYAMWAAALRPEIVAALGM